MVKKNDVVAGLVSLSTDGGTGLVARWGLDHLFQKAQRRKDEKATKAYELLLSELDGASAAEDPDQHFAELLNNAPISNRVIETNFR